MSDNPTFVKLFYANNSVDLEFKINDWIADTGVKYTNLNIISHHTNLIAVLEFEDRL